MYGEPNIYEYAEMVSEANKSISTNGFKCIHWNTGWVGYYIETPKGNKYQLVKKGIFDKDGYYLCEDANESFCTGKRLGLIFKDLEQCKKYLILKESTKTDILTAAKEDMHSLKDYLYWHEQCYLETLCRELGGNNIRYDDAKETAVFDVEYKSLETTIGFNHESLKYEIMGDVRVYDADCLSLIGTLEEGSLENNNESHKKLDSKILDAKESTSKNDKVVATDRER